jgi:hypothetical protein
MESIEGWVAIFWLLSGFPVFKSFPLRIGMTQGAAHGAGLAPTYTASLPFRKK